LTKHDNEPGERRNADRARVVERRKADALNLTKPHITGKACIEFEGPTGPLIIRLKGWELWALRMLVKAGAKGLKPIEHPGPRWADLGCGLNSSNI